MSVKTKKVADKKQSKFVRGVVSKDTITLSVDGFYEIIERARELRQTLIAVEQHLEELREAWERGCISEHDGQGGTRSNRNMDLLVRVRAAIRGPKKES